MRNDRPLNSSTLLRTLPRIVPLLCAIALVACTQPAPPAEPLSETGAQGWRLPSQHGEIEVQQIAEGLDHPWSLAFLPDGGMLVTERSGQLRRVSMDGEVSAPFRGVPAVFAEGQGGLLDVVPSPDFETDGLIYLSYAEPGEAGTAGTAVARARLAGNALEDLQVIFRQQPKIESRHHFGARIVFDDGGHVFITTGERGDRMTSQDLSKHMGKVIRLMRDGSVPEDNPFVGRDDAQPEIWSYGHRNMQGAARNPWTGALWTSEHGPRGGDEVNIPQPGLNYGWPIITHGINYSGLKIPEAEGQAKEGLEPPHHVWEVSPALSGMAFYDHARHPAWQRSLFLGALVQTSLIRLTLDGDAVVGEERLLESLGWRIRDVRVGPDGSVYVVTDDDNGRVLRIDLRA